MAPAPILMTRKNAAALLSISVGMLDKLVRQGVLEPIRLGTTKRVYFRRDAIEELTLPPSRRRAFRNLDVTLPMQ
jgi:excisionase family DNA binding protein